MLPALPVLSWLQCLPHTRFCCYSTGMAQCSRLGEEGLVKRLSSFLLGSAACDALLNDSCQELLWSAKGRQFTWGPSALLKQACCGCWSCVSLSLAAVCRGEAAVLGGHQTSAEEGVTGSRAFLFSAWQNQHTSAQSLPRRADAAGALHHSTAGTEPLPIAHVQEVQCHCLMHVQEILPKILLPGNWPPGHFALIVGASQRHAE